MSALTLPDFSKYCDRRFSAPRRAEALQEEYHFRREKNKKYTVNDFFAMKIQEYNNDIHNFVEEGREKCGPEYILPTITFDDNPPNDPYFELQNYACSSNFNNLVMLDEYVLETLTAWHKNNIKLYENYDKNYKCFASLKNLIFTIGGEAMPMRPYFKVVLPTPGTLHYESHTLACSDYNLLILKQLLNELAEKAKL